MHKRFIVFLLVLLNVWQVASAAGPLQAWLAVDPTLAHVAMHESGEAHHHHGNDGDIHVDTSQDSIQHMMADCCFHHVGVIAAPVLVSFEPIPQHVAQQVQSVPPAPYLDGLRRPPRALS